MRWIRSISWFLILCPELLPAAGSEDVVFFESKIRPLLVEHCYECHSVRAKEVRGGLLLDSRAGVRKGGDSGAVLVPGQPNESRLLRALSYRDSDLQMPPKGKLPDGDLALLREWIERGAPDPRQEMAGPVAEEPGIDYEEGRRFWSFVRPEKRPLPEVTGKLDWVRNEIDQFILAKLEQADLAPASEADRRTLVRRAYLDLHGLPPTTDQIDAFLLDNRPDAWERLVDELLSSPRYGERWGRHWLDVARYSDSNGMDEDIAHPEAWRYRDYVIRSFNQDKRFDQFIVEQLAGDLLPSRDLAEKRDQHAALGFLSVGPKMLACDDPDKMRRDIVDEQLDTTGRAFMGMTLGCARCHDHKFDPVSIEDYYGLAGIFLSTKTLVKYSVVAQYHEHDLTEPEVAKRWNRVSELEKRRGAKTTPGEEKEKLEAEITELKKGLSRRHKVMGVTEDKTIDTKVHLRGNYMTLGKSVPRRVLPVIAGLEQAPMPVRQSGRLELARWIAGMNNPLTARVIVNRLWRWHFGRGLVPTPDNFGILGERPTHPELLDYLAIDFVEKDWSLKALHRKIMFSATYRQSPHATRARKLDPENKLFARWKPRRMEAEVVRDSILFKANRLDLKMGGGVIQRKATEYINKGKMTEWIKSTRRTVYLPVIRSAGYDELNAFDFADPSVPDGNRRTSTVTPQALVLMNSPLVHESAMEIAGIMLQETKELDPAGRADWLIRHYHGRPGRKDEIGRLVEHVRSYPIEEGAEQREKKTWAGVARALMAANEFLYID
ncbi:MAG: hypothetical protein CMO40_05085 [Verrucomicrobiaceae bacterium]|nr:hypothetical protein [Verrucomicrobiaceae bacterium]